MKFIASPFLIALMVVPRILKFLEIHGWSCIAPMLIRALNNQA
jgi:hypothetical protein